MTRKEMTELFSVMLLAWPNAEAFKGGVQKLAPTIRLWTACTADVDLWTGQQAVYRLCKSCKFPPTIAEFRAQAERVNAEIQAIAGQVAMEIRAADALCGSVAAFYETLPKGALTREAIDVLGGPDALTISLTHDGKTASVWNLQGIEAACRMIVQKQPAWIGGKLPAILSAENRS